MSLRLRLTLWYAGMTSMAVLVISVLAYAAHSHTNYDELDSDLIAAAAHARSEYENAEGLQGLASMLSTPIIPNVAVLLYGSGGGMLYASPNSVRVPALDARALSAVAGRRPYDLLVSLAPHLGSADPGAGAFDLLTAAEGSRWRIYVLPTRTPGVRVVTAASLEGIDRAVQAFRSVMVLLSVLSMTLSPLPGWLLAGRALRPVASLTEAAATITRAREFHHRVPAPGSRDELGRLAETLNEMLASLEQAYQAQQRFVADASHELRAPLTAIQGNLELLERQPQMSPQEQREAIQEATREARRMTRLVAELLVLARADAGASLRHEQVELDRVALEALGDARHLANGQRIDITKLEPALVTGDWDRLKQLFLILLDNAVKYTPAGGRITLTLRRNGGHAETTITDSGMGIAPEEVPRVFERFYRTEEARAQDPTGTGLGLSIARWIAAQHGGEIVLSSAPGQGVTATVRLPLLAGSA